MRPVILDIDGSVAAIDASVSLDVKDWHDALRFACSVKQLTAFARMLDGRLPAQHGTVFMGSGDFHHLSLPLIARAAEGRQQVEVVVFDNHPDNMRFPFAVHCGSWVWRVASLPQVAHVHVVGITSNDIAWTHAWENHLRPLYRGRVTYWSTGVAVGWANRIGLGEAIRAFDSTADLLDAFMRQMQRSSAPVYLSIDKDVLDPSEVTTNWDQGRLRTAAIIDVIEYLRTRLIGSDVTGDISVARYPQWWKRLLSGLDRQVAPDPQSVQAWQAQQHAINRRLWAAIAGHAE
jgi:hypothetical protein